MSLMIMSKRMSQMSVCWIDIVSQLNVSQRMSQMSLCWMDSVSQMGIRR